MPGAPFGSTKSASSHTQHPTGHVAIMAMELSSPVNHRFAASSTARHASRTDSHSVLTQGNDLLDEHDVAVASVGSGGLVHARHGAFQDLTTGA
eukprot:scaffold23994_cov63-Phaeocystis_antarctica.AAC.3